MSTDLINHSVLIAVLIELRVDDLILVGGQQRTLVRNPVQVCNDSLSVMASFSNLYVAKIYLQMDVV